MAYKKHMMYSDDESEMAQTNAEHLSLKKKGWGHEKPSGFKLREVNSPMLCWKTHERVPGTTEGAKKSCQHKNPAKRPK
tara:strand:+ start:840 stop:1076 length:237 start_codon:yes stop_codon:yes gene_type:complete